MIEAGSKSERNVYFFGYDAVLREALEKQATALGMLLFSVQTVAGLMCLNRLRCARVLILQTECVPAGRSVPALLDRLEAQCGRRPRLIALVPGRGRSSLGAALGSASGEAIAVLRPPFDARQILKQAAVAFALHSRRLMRVIFMDGTPGEGEVLAAGLRDEGFEVERLSDPDQGIGVLEAHSADLVLLDLCLPEEPIGRFSAALRAHPRLQRVPLIFLAPPGEGERSSNLLRVGRDEYLARPLSPGRLAATVRGRLARAAREARARRPPSQRPARPYEPLSGPAAPPDDVRILEWVRGGLTGPGFHLVYQPIVSLHRHHERYEALLRLTAPTGEVLPPLKFLPVVARHGMLPDLDRWVLGAALATLRRERDAGRPTRLVVFQSGASLAVPDWLDWLRAEVARLDLIRQRPALEFSLPEILENEDQARLLFPELGRLGIEVCLAGVTDHRDCLGLIARRPIRTAKLARELVANRDSTRLAALVDALHQRHARVIAAGIETPDAIGYAWSSGVDYVQGNLIQPPQEALNFRFHEGLAA